MALDDNLSDGFVQFIVRLCLGFSPKYEYEDEFDYYLGRVIGDAITQIMGCNATATGIIEIIDAISGGVAITISSGGVLTIGGISIVLEGVAAGTVEIGAGIALIKSGFDGFDEDFYKLQEARKTKKTVSGSDKEKATDVPSWAKGNAPYEDENGTDFAKRLCDERFGENNYNKGPGSAFNKIKKWGDRGFK